MATQLHHHPSPAETFVTSRFQRALASLVDASDYAAQTSGSPWEFAVEIHQLHRLGLSDNDLRFLVRLGFLDHACEVTTAANDGRQFLATGDLYFSKRSCFVLTSSGIAKARDSFDTLAESHLPSPATFRISADSEMIEVACVPTWNAQRRVLSFAGQLVKQFKRHAVNQELVLTVFQEEGWPTRILDPLPPLASEDIKRRLSDTVKWLNRGQELKLVHFRGDGTGEGVTWEPVIC